ncbi:MAG: glycosyltransferase [Candidatus Hodarchaeota archaeon]
MEENFLSTDQVSLTVIIPTYNEEKNIKETIFSVKNQKTNLKYEILVCDGGSTDRTVEIAQEYVQIIKSPEKGKVPQINYAAKQSNGKILIFLDADTQLPDNYFDLIYRKFQKNKNLLACSAPHIYRSNYIISAGTIFISLILIMASSLLFGVMIFCQLMFYLFLRNKKVFPITPYFSLTQLLILYYVARTFFKFIEFSGSNMCVRRDIFNKIGGLKPVPNSKGIDSVFSSALRKYCRYNKGEIKMTNTLAVFTDPRFISRKRILKRLKQHKKVAKYYEKIVKIRNKIQR